MRQRGFTLVELACTIVIVGTLAVVAVPRALDFLDEAAHAEVAQRAAAFATAVQFVRLTYIARGRSGNVDNLAGFGDGTVDTNAGGYPTDTANANTIPNNATGATRCRNVLLGILAGPMPVCGGSIACTGAHVYQAVTTAAQTCRFNYIKDPTPARFFIYNAATGQVAQTNP
jgi:prepilin-type N-terminal cleavage/methylation domain-containing protein